MSPKKLSPKILKRKRRRLTRAVSSARLHVVSEKIVDAVYGSQRHSLVWGFLMGLSSVALCAYHPALAEDGRFQPQNGKRDGQTPEAGLTFRHDSLNNRNAQHLITKPWLANRRQNADRTHRFTRLLAARQEASTGTKQPIDIPSGDLQSALVTLSEQAGLQLLYGPELVAGQRTEGARGQYTSEEALQMLLNGTGLQYRFSDAGTAILQTASAQDDELPSEDAANNEKEREAPKHIKVPEIVVKDVVDKSKVFLPPDEGYKADEATTTTRTRLPIKETPSSIGVVTKDLIRDTFSLRPTDAFEAVSGVSSGGPRRGRTEEFNIRGFSITADFGLDGSGGSGGLRENGLATDSLFATDPAIVERYEVLKGPASIQGGSVSPGGVINRITKKPLDVNAAEFTGQGGSFGLARGVIDANGVLPQNQDLRGRLIFAVEDGGNFVDDVAVRQYTVAPSAEWLMFEEAGVLRLSGRYQKFDGSSYLGFPFLANGERPDISRTRNIGGGSENGATTELESSTVQAEYEHVFLDGLTLSAKGGYQRSTQFSRDIYAYQFGGVGTNGNTYIYAGENDSTWETFSGELFLHKEFTFAARKQEILLGADHRDQTHELANSYLYLGTDNIFNPANNFQIPPSGTLNPFNDRETSLTQTGLFGQLVLRPLERLTIVAAGRQDWAEVNFFQRLTDTRRKKTPSAFTGRIGATVEVAPWLRVYGGYQESFLANAFNVSVDQNLIPPETGQSYEIGAKLNLAQGRLLITTALFRTYRQNVATADLANPGFSISNGEQRSQGVELDVNGEPVPGLNISANFSYVDIEVTESTQGLEGNRPAFVPVDYVGRVWGTYTFQSGPLKDFGFGGGVFFHSGFHLDPTETVTSDAFERVDAVAFYRPPQKWYEFAINVRNLLDKTYIESPGSIAVGNYFGAPVSVFGTLRVHFDSVSEWTPPWVQ